MRYLVISDIHGGSAAARRALAWKDQLGADMILVMGDVLYHGPRNPLPEAHQPQEVAAILNRYAGCIRAVRGNCDAEIDQVMLQFPIMNDFRTFRLGNGRKVIMTHGHLNEYRMGLEPGAVVLSGHTHVATAERDDEGIYRCNPGSAAMPKGDLPATFGLLDDESFSVRDLESGVQYLSIDLGGLA